MLLTLLGYSLLGTDAPQFLLFIALPLVLIGLVARRGFRLLREPDSGDKRTGRILLLLASLVVIVYLVLALDRLLV